MAAKKQSEAKPAAKPSACTPHNFFIVSLGVLGFACIFLTLFLWREADVNTEQLAASHKTYDAESNQALQAIIAFEERFIKHEISAIDDTTVRIKSKVEEIKKENKDLANYLARRYAA